MDLFEISAKKIFTEPRGTLGVIEFQNLPFIPHRLYWIINVPDKVSRGSHAHKELKQCFFSICGNFTLIIRDGVQSQTIEIQAGDPMTYVGPGLWRELTDFSQDAIACVIVDNEYQETDYIRNWSEYLKWVGSKDSQ